MIGNRSRNIADVCLPYLEILNIIKEPAFTFSSQYNSRTLLTLQALIFHESKIMKLLPVTILALLFVQQAACTHLETCECDEIRAMVNATVEEAISRLESKF